MLTNIIPKQLLAVELAGDEIRAAVVRRKGRRFEVVDFAGLKRPDPQDDLPAVDILKSLADRLRVAGGPGVLVTPMARAFELLMDRKKVAGMRRYQLQEAVRWEVEPYTGITGSSALVGVEAERKIEPRPGEILPEADMDQVTVTVAAIERNVYRAARERFKVAGLRLLRIYPPEEVFYYALFLDGTDSPRALLEVGHDYSNFAILRGGIPEQINTLSLSLDGLMSQLSGGTASRELEDSLKFTVRQTPAPEPLVISGAGANHSELVDYIGKFCPHGARPLALDRTAGVADAREEGAHAAFSTAVGAAVRELKGSRERKGGINDRLPLVPRLKRSVYLVPVVTAVTVGILLAGHYQFMRHQERRYKARITELNKEVKGRRAEIDKYESLLAESNALEKEIDQANKRLKYIQGEAKASLNRMITCLEEMAAALPERIVLRRVSQGGLNIYKVAGSAFVLEGIGDFATRLQEKPWCEAAVIEKVEKNADGRGLAFEMTIQAGGERA